MTTSGSRAEGLARLDAFIPSSGAVYARERNTDYGSDEKNAVSRLSPFIRHRLIGEDEVVAAALAAHGPDASEKFVQEVFWRSYFKGWLEMRPAVWKNYLDEREDAFHQLARDRALAVDYRAATEGRTGIDAFDAFAAELVETGYLHNHARMWFASIWIFTLRLPWTLGADLFLRHLMDGDPASNTLSWRWVAGLQTRGKNYLATRANIERFTNGRFSPKGLVEDAAPLDGPPPPPIQPIAPADEPETKPSFLLLHEDDGLGGIHPPDLPPDVAGVAGLATSQNRSPEPIGVKARTFSHEALKGALDRRGHVTSVHVAGADEDALLDLIVKSGVAQVVTPHAPVGPAKAALDSLDARLKDNAIAMVRTRRHWDTNAWPHATAGFFKFKKAIPGLIANAGL